MLNYPIIVFFLLLTYIHAAQLLSIHCTLIANCKNVELVEQFWRKLHVFHSTCKRWKRKQSLGKDKLVLSQHIRLKIRCNFETNYRCLRDLFTYRDTHNSKFVNMKMYVKVMMYNIRSSTIRWKIHDFLSNGNSNVCNMSHSLRDVRKIRKIQKV